MNISMFDILGPIMIGPSSSHTAGAQRIGKAMYNMIADKQLQAVHFILHGSFHLTLRGHGTDRALVGGGEIEIVDINGTPAKFSGRYPAVVINHIDRLGIISHITSILAINQINIVTVVNSRDSTGKKAVTMIETETLVDTSVKKELESMSAVESVVTMEKVS